MLLLKLMWLLIGVGRKQNVQATENSLSKEMLTGKGTEAEPKIHSCTTYPTHIIKYRTSPQIEGCNPRKSNIKSATDRFINR